MKKKKVITIVLTVIFISIIFIGLFFFQSQRSRAFSESNCTTLGWSTAGGSASVCGESDASPLAGCSGALNWSAAVSFCEAVGARLCTKAEIDADEAAGTGCSYDSELVWTSTRCDDYGSYWRIKEKTALGQLILVLLSQQVHMFDVAET